MYRSVHRVDTHSCVTHRKHNCVTHRNQSKYNTLMDFSCAGITSLHTEDKHNLAKEVKQSECWLILVIFDFHSPPPSPTKNGSDNNIPWFKFIWWLYQWLTVWSMDSCFLLLWNWRQSGRLIKKTSLPEESTYKWNLYITQQTESPSMTTTWQAYKCNVHKLC